MLLERLAWRNLAGASTVMCPSESVVGSSVDGPGPSENPFVSSVDGALLERSVEIRSRTGLQFGSVQVFGARLRTERSN